MIEAPYNKVLQQTGTALELFVTQHPWQPARQVNAVVMRQGNGFNNPTERALYGPARRYFLSDYVLLRFP
jgi:hypothetical protein